MVLSYPATLAKYGEPATSRQRAAAGAACATKAVDPRASGHFSQKAALISSIAGGDPLVGV
jgi:hypothetical protein